MILPEIQEMVSRVKQLTDEGYGDSAKRVVSDTVQHLLLDPFTVNNNKILLAHYTTVDALFSMLSCPVQTNQNFALSSSAPNEVLDMESCLRMYDTYNSNDPLEGRFFVESKPSRHRFPSKHPDAWKLLCDRSQLPAYVTSFRAVQKIEDVDDLVFWRTYGKDVKGAQLCFLLRFSRRLHPYWK